jgi:hypothetical protein
LAVLRRALPLRISHSPTVFFCFGCLRGMTHSLLLGRETSEARQKRMTRRSRLDQWNLSACAFASSTFVDRISMD